MRKLLKRFIYRRARAVQGGTAGERAGRLFDGGLNCAQAVLKATSGDIDESLLEMSGAFGGGIGGSKCLCGAVSGGVMALGLAGKGRLSGRLVANFKARNKVTCCKALSAPYRWKSPEHLSNCRRMTVETADDVAQLLGPPGDIPKP